MEHHTQEVVDDRATLRLEPSLRIGDLEARRDVLLAQLDGRKPIRIDVSALQTVDTAGVQLLLAFRRETDRRGIQLDYCGESPELRNALKLLGLTEAVLGRRP